MDVVAKGGIILNKRIRKKIMKRKNTQRQNILLDEIKKIFKIDTLLFTDGYFIFRMNPNAVCHFTINETPDWLYGIWLGENNNFHIFGEHTDLVDKFKPSRTYLSYENDIDSFIEDLNNIKENPKLYFVDSLTGSALVDFKEYNSGGNVYYYGYQAVNNFDEDTHRGIKTKRDKNISQEDFVNKEYEEFHNEKQQRLKDEDFDRKFAFDFFKEILDFDDGITGVGIYDRNRGGWRTSPRYVIRIIIENPHIEISKKLSDLIHNKNMSKDRKTYEHQFRLRDICFDLKDINDSDYKYVK